MTGWIGNRVTGWIGNRRTGWTAKEDWMDWQWDNSRSKLNVYYAVWLEFPYFLHFYIIYRCKKGDCG